MTKPASRGGTWSALRDFLHSEAAGGVVLIAATAAALILANWPATAPGYAALVDHRTGPVLVRALGPMTLHLWINDGLMALFFLLVGLEIKRELVDGELAAPERRRLPFVAAGAGMIVPALVYLLATRGTPGLARGWAIPAATDIAFAIGVLALLGSRVPAALKLMLTTIAIVDDMGAVAIIAAAYTEAIHVGPLAGAMGVFAMMMAMNRLGVRRLSPYLAAFALLWLLVLASGIHATVAGVAAAAAIPLTRSPGAPDDRTSPLHRLEHALHPWVAYAVVPLFALANAGVTLSGVSPATLAEPLVIALMLGLFVGKQAGIFGAIWLADRSGFARKPRRIGWVQLYGMALVAGIGFTMSLFIGALAFADPALADRVRIGVLAGSLLSAVAGAAVLWVAGQQEAPAR